jgi:hypothetical protein
MSSKKKFIREGKGPKRKKESKRVGEEKKKERGKKPVETGGPSVRTGYHTGAPQSLYEANVLKEEKEKMTKRRLSHRRSTVLRRMSWKEKGTSKNDNKKVITQPLQWFLYAATTHMQGYMADRSCLRVSGFVVSTPRQFHAPPYSCPLTI